MENNLTSSAITWTPGRVVQATLIVVAVTFALLLIFRFSLVVFSLFEAIVFGTALIPIVNWLYNRGLPRVLSIGIVSLIILGVIVGFGLLLAPVVVDQGAFIGSTLAKFYLDFRESLLQSSSILLQRIAIYLPIGIPSTPVTANEPQSLEPVAGVLVYGESILRGIFTSLAVLLLTIYWVLDRERILRWFVLLFPSQWRETVRDFITETEEKVGAYLRGLAVLCLSVGLMALVAYLIIGLPNALLLAILAGILEAVPLVGPILGAIPAVFIALAVHPDKVTWVILATVIIQLLENNLLVPRIMDRAVGVNPVITLLAFAAFSSLFGLAGALLAIPLAVVAKLLFNRVVLDINLINQPTPAGRDKLSVLRYEAQELVQDVRKQVREKDGTIDDVSDQVEDAIEAIVNDLDSILARAETVQ